MTKEQATREALEMALNLIIEGKYYALECTHMASKEDCDRYDAVAAKIKEALSTKCVAQPEKTVCPFCSSEWVTAEQHDRKMDRMEQERCVGCEACIDTACGRDECPKGWPKALQPEQEPVAWKLVPIKPTREMLRAMDECSTEGYDERLYAGHAASVYMAAVDVAPNPPEARNQEPVAFICEFYADEGHPFVSFEPVTHGTNTPLYASPPPVAEPHKRPSRSDIKPLTDEEIGAILEGVNAYGTRLYTFARAIEAAHGIKE